VHDEKTDAEGQQAEGSEIQVEAVGEARDIPRTVGRFEPQGQVPGQRGQIGGLLRRDDQVIGIGPVEKARSRGDVCDGGGGGRGVEDGDGGQASGQGTVRRGPGHQEEAGLPQKGRRIRNAATECRRARFLRGGERVDPDEPQPPISVPDLPGDDR
jgi:hypothetical protein